MELDASQTEQAPTDRTQHHRLLISPGGTKYWIPQCDDALKPHNGQRFKALNETVDFYQLYASTVGFDVRHNMLVKARDKTILWKYLVCSREGYKQHTNTGQPGPSENRVRRRRVSNRVGCNARIMIRFDGRNGYVVRSFEEKHNHTMIPDERRSRLKINRNMSVAHQNFVLSCIKASIGPIKSHKQYKEMVGGYSNIGATDVDFKNFKRELLAFIVGADAQLVVDKFYKRQENNSAFYFQYEVDDEHRLRRLFWADPISRRNYSSFGDFVSFDATYHTNRYNMIFAPFTGIDNHNKCVTFAAALISNEDVGSYVWVFENFKNTMIQEPNYMITDQDPSIGIAFTKVFTSTKHRFCTWHIMNKLYDKVGHDLTNDTNFKRRINELVWCRLIVPDEFETKWVSIMKDYSLDTHRWFNDLYAKKEHWIPAYFRDVGMSGLMRTTSRSESENNWFSSFTNNHSSLVEFLLHFYSAMDAQRNTSMKLQNDCETHLADLKTPLLIEKCALDVYTTTIFYRVQAEICDACFKCRVMSCSENDGRMEFTIRDIDGKTFNVMHNANLNTSHCSCKHFEMYGWLCRHAFVALKDMNVDVIPPAHIMSRWTKLAISTPMFRILDSISEECAQIDERKSMVNQLWSDLHICMGLAEKHVDYLVEFSKIIGAHKRKLVEYQESNSSGNDRGHIFESFVGMSAPSEVSIHPPTQSKNKGSGRRMKNNKEKSIETSNKKRRICKSFGERAGHNARTCPKKP